MLMLITKNKQLKNKNFENITIVQQQRSTSSD